MSAEDKSVDRPSDQFHSFMFKASANEGLIELDSCNKVEHTSKCNNLLVDCGATSHIIKDSSKFMKFDSDFNPFNHFIELADGSRTGGVAHGRGAASVLLFDINGSPHKVRLENALYVPSYKQNLFSVQAATEKGASVSFSSKSAELKASDGISFPIEKEGKLYYLNNVNVCKNVSYSLSEWHKIMGHCNFKDLEKLENVVNGMKILSKEKYHCETCAVGKMFQYRNREADKCATSRLELVHCDLTRPIDPIARDCFRYSISFVDDYTGTIMVYFFEK